MPVVALVQDVRRTQTDRNAFQDLDHPDLFRACAKWVRRVSELSRIDDYVDMAFTAAASGRPGPAVLLCPQDLLQEEAPGAPTAARRRNLGSYPLDRVVADPARVARGRRHAGRGAQPARRRGRRRAPVGGACGARAAAADGLAPGRDDQHGQGRGRRAPPAVGRRDRLLHGHAQRHQGAAAARVRRRRDPVRRRPHQPERHRFVDAVPARARPTSTSTSTARKSAATTRRCGWSATRS